MKFSKLIALLLLLAMLIGTASGCNRSDDDTDTDTDTDTDEKSSLVLNYSLDESSGSFAKESVSGKDYTINYVFNEQNAADLFKEPNDPLRRPGVKGNALYMDGFSNNIVNKEFTKKEYDMIGCNEQYDFCESETYS